MTVGVETFGNQPSAEITSGGTTTSLSDDAFTATPQNSTVWPVASASAVPPTFFRIVDQANTSEIMIVTTAPGGSGSGQSWSVTRAAEGTTAVAHAANWIAVQAVTAGTLANIKQATKAASTVTLASSTTETVLASYTPQSSELVAGVSFEAVAFGTYGIASASSRPVLTFRLRWGGVSGTLLASLATGTNIATFSSTTVASGCSFDVNGTVTWVSATQAAANLNLWMNNPTTGVNATTTGVSSPALVTISGSGPLVLTAQWSVSNASNTLTATSPLIYRAA
jgi:hypothetical protein